MTVEEDKLTVLFDDVGYRTLSLPVVRGQQLFAAAERSRAIRLPRTAPPVRLSAWPFPQTPAASEAELRGVR